MKFQARIGAESTMLMSSELSVALMGQYDEEEDLHHNHQKRDFEGRDHGHFQNERIDAGECEERNPDTHDSGRRQEHCDDRRQDGTHHGSEQDRFESLALRLHDTRRQELRALRSSGTSPAASRSNLKASWRYRGADTVWGCVRHQYSGTLGSISFA